MTDNLKYLKNIVNEDERFGIMLNEYGKKHKAHIQLKIALSLLEYFNGGKYVNENQIIIEDGIFYRPKGKKFRSKVFSIRVNITDSDENVERKLDKLKTGIYLFRS